jgi:hypothetical protein
LADVGLRVALVDVTFALSPQPELVCGARMTARDKGRRLLDWFLMEPRAREVVARALDREQKDTLALARGADELAQAAAQDSATRWGGVRPQSALLALYAEAAYWALRSQVPSVFRTGDGGLRGLVDRIGPSAIEEVIGPACALDLKEALLLSHDQLAVLDAGQWATVLERAACVARKILEAAEAPTQAIRALRAARILRIVTIPVLCALLVLRLASPKDFAHGKLWRATSSLGGAPASGTLSSTDGPFFFHTNNEPDPAIVVDIGLHTIHKVVLTNRRDCCQDRATPIVIETIAPGGVWRTVARRDEPFTEWAATFPPLVANQVRVRATRTTHLHLADIEVF